ncbi:MAG: glycosyltransferase [Balneola sp.]
MKIAFVSDQFFPRTSADSEQIISSLSALSDKAEVVLLSASYLSQKKTHNADLEKYYGRECNFKLDFIDHLFKNIRGIEKLFFALRSAIRLKKDDYELIYTRNIPVVIAVLALTNFPVLFESYRPWPNRNFFSNWLFKRLAKVDRFLGVILHSNFAKQSFLEVGFNENNLLVAHNAFDFSLYNEINSEEIRGNFDLPKDKLIITYSGRITEEKGLLRIIELAKRFPDQFFLLIGSEKNGEVEEKAKSIDNIKILGWLDRKTVFSLLRASDILYLPPTLKAREISKNTVLPIKTFIYKASGTPILGPDIEDVAEVLTNMKTAVLVEPDNLEKEIEGLETLVRDKELRQRLGSSAKREMEKSTWDNRAKSIFKFISENISDT